MGRSIFFFIFLLILGCGDKRSKNIYDSEEFKNLSDKDILVGEAIWMSNCFRCHMYGSMGAASVSNKPHFDQLAQKGIDQLYNSVLNGFDGKRSEEHTSELQSRTNLVCRLLLEKKKKERKTTKKTTNKNKLIDYIRQ